MQVRGSGGSPALHTGGQAARVRARAFALRPFGLPAPSALAARQLPVAAQRRSAAHQTLHLEVDSRGRCSTVAGHGLVIRHELASVAASGRIGCCCPGQPCAACSSAAARRTQQAADTAARRALRGRAEDGPSQREIRRTPGHPMPRTTAMRRAASTGKHQCKWIHDEPNGCEFGWMQLPLM